jgi:hypothetical protein
VLDVVEHGCEGFAAVRGPTEKGVRREGAWFGSQGRSTVGEGTDGVTEDRFAHDRELEVSSGKPDGVVTTLESGDPGPKQVDEALGLEKVVRHPNGGLVRT